MFWSILTRSVAMVFGITIGAQVIGVLVDKSATK